MIAVKLRPVTTTLLDWSSQRSIDVKCQWDTQTSMLVCKRCCCAVCLFFVLFFCCTSPNCGITLIIMVKQVTLQKKKTNNSLCIYHSMAKNLTGPYWNGMLYMYITSQHEATLLLLLLVLENILFAAIFWLKIPSRFITIQVVAQYFIHGK